MASSNSGADGERISLNDIDRILSTTFIQAVDYSEQLPSTNTRALQLAAQFQPETPSPTLVIADVQTAGRGRGSNCWWSGSGSLTFSVIFRSESLQLPPKRWPQLSLVAGLAVCDTIEALARNSNPRLKWPNDVLIDGRKVCGILIEASDGKRGCVIVGIGLNVNNELESAPRDLRSGVATLGENSSAPIHHVDVLVDVLQRLESRINWLASDPESFRGEWSQRCILTGKHVELGVHLRQIAGMCVGIDCDGALILNTTSGQERCLSGTVLKYY